MTSKKNTRRALFSSLLSLLLCVSMLLGTTFAWFTDSVTSENNIIKSGTLEVEMYWADGKENPNADTTDWTDASAGAIFDYDLWEPGYTEVRHIKIKNVGTLALKYQLAIDATDAVSDLSDVIDVYFADPAVQVADRTGLTDANKVGTLTNVLAGMPENASGTLNAGTEVTVTLALKMQETAGNEYMDKAIGSSFAVQLVATQLAAETDSFDNQYDAEADYVVYYDTPGTYELNASLMATKATDVITVKGENTVLNIMGGYYDAGNQDCAVWAYDGGVVNIHGGRFLCDGMDEATSGNHQDMIYAGSNGGKINIYGGHFESRGEAWLLNEKDNQGEIVVYGGTFVNWNPADNDSEGANTSFVPKGIPVIDQVQSNGDVWYIVDAKIVDSADEAYEVFSSFDQSGKSGTVVLNADYNTADAQKHWSGNREYAIRRNTTTLVGTDVTLNLNGHSINHNGTYQDGNNTGYTYLFTTAYDGKLTVNGEGSIYSKNTEGHVSIFYAQGPSEIVINGGDYHAVSGVPVWAGNNAKVTINGGSFISDGATNEELIYSSGGVIDIYGGFFHNTGWENRPVNVANANRGTGFINIYGGTFVNFDPSTGGDDPNNILVADGYKVVSETQANGDVWYTVVQE